MFSKAPLSSFTHWWQNFPFRFQSHIKNYFLGYVYLKFLPQFTRFWEFPSRLITFAFNISLLSCLPLNFFLSLKVTLNSRFLRVEVLVLSFPIQDVVYWINRKKMFHRSWIHNRKLFSLTRTRKATQQTRSSRNRI